MLKSGAVFVTEPADLIAALQPMIERPAGSVTELAPVVTAPAPVHVVLAFGVPAIDRPAGSVSCTVATPLVATGPLLVTVSV